MSLRGGQNVAARGTKCRCGFLLVGTAVRVFFFNGVLRIPCHLCGLPGVLSLMAGGEDAVGSSPATQT